MNIPKASAAVLTAFVFVLSLRVAPVTAQPWSGSGDAIDPYQIWDANDNVLEQKYLELGEKITLGNYNYKFKSLRQWASFKVVDDPGYPLVCFSLWLGLIALIMRYTKEIKSCFKESNDIE